MTYDLTNNRKGEETQRHRKEGHMKTEAETGVMCLQVNDYQRSLAAVEARRKTKYFPSKSPEETSHADSLILDFLPPEL